MLGGTHDARFGLSELGLELLFLRAQFRAPPFVHFTDNFVGDLRNQFPGNIHTIDLLQMLLNFSGRQPLRIQRNDRLIEPLDPASVFRDYLRF
jgi:hypothetical protein